MAGTWVTGRGDVNGKEGRRKSHRPKMLIRFNDQRQSKLTRQKPNPPRTRPHTYMKHRPRGILKTGLLSGKSSDRNATSTPEFQIVYAMCEKSSCQVTLQTSSIHTEERIIIGHTSKGWATAHCQPHPRETIIGAWRPPDANHLNHAYRSEILRNFQRCAAIDLEDTDWLDTGAESSSALVRAESSSTEPSY